MADDGDRQNLNENQRGAGLYSGSGEDSSSGYDEGGEGEARNNKGNEQAHDAPSVERRQRRLAMNRVSARERRRRAQRLRLEQEEKIRNLSERLQIHRQHNGALQITTTRLATELSQAQNTIRILLGTRQTAPVLAYQNFPFAPQNNLIPPNAANSMADLGRIQALARCNLLHNASTANPVNNSGDLSQSQTICSAVINQPAENQIPAPQLRVSENLGVAMQIGDLPPFFSGAAGLVHAALQANQNATSLLSPFVAYLSAMGAGAVNPLAMVCFISSTVERTNSALYKHASRI